MFPGLASMTPNFIFLASTLLAGLLASSVALSESLTAQVVYPFDLPSRIEATINVDTKQTTPVKEMLFGLNCNWPEGDYGKVGYNHSKAQELILGFNPSSLRFPHGVWSNFYDYESDGRRMTDNYETLYDTAVRDHPDLKYGIDGLERLHDRLGFDVLFTWNVNYDNAEKGARRLVDTQQRGFNVKWIELGNEIFWKTQRSEAVRTVEKYIEVSKGHAAAIREISPSVKISVPVQWRKAETDHWNAVLKNEDFFDAVTVHKYIHGKSNREGAAELLRAGRDFIEMADTMEKVFPGRPLWISEWAVDCGENAISALAMANVYLTLVEYQDRFEIADFFQMNAGHPLLQYDKKSETYTRTSFGAVYEIIRGVFEQSHLCESQIESPIIADGVEAVSALAVLKKGELIVIAINQTPKHVPLDLTMNGSISQRPLVHHALAFDDVNQWKMFEMDESVMQPQAGGLKNDRPTNQIILPPLSINRISINQTYESVH